MRMSTWAWFVLGVALAAALPACQVKPPSAPAAAPVGLEEVTRTSYLYEVVRYLYRWHLDEADVERVIGQERLVFWIHRLDAKLDPGDKSVLAEIVLPQLGVTVRVKKSDYVIEELGAAVKSRGFVITAVTRAAAPSRAPANCQVVDVGMRESLDYLMRTRYQHDFADPALLEHLRQALRREAARENLPIEPPVGEQVAHLAPLSPVANENWVFWEAGRKLFFFSSDLDLADPDLWKYQTLTVRVYDLDQQVVVSREEAPGSNRVLTRAEVGRALFNCIVLGQRVTVPAYTPPTTVPAVGEGGAP